jgi:hypothetical protein
MLSQVASDKNNFLTIAAYRDFARMFLDLWAGRTGIQAEIVARGENQYVFLQYDQTADYQVTRPLNKSLMATAESFDSVFSSLINVVEAVRDHQPLDDDMRAGVTNAIYTVQQSIGAALDGLPVGHSNQARKVNGDLFERLMNFLVQGSGIDCRSGVLKVPVRGDDGTVAFYTQYQHDMMLEIEGELRVIGSVKTSSKDRVDKIFIDKFLYNRLTGTTVPHVAIFLHDVQRVGKEQSYRISSTFLPGRFKMYTVKLNPLDGVFYCDLRPQMVTDPILREEIRSIDSFFFDLLPTLVA